MDLPCVPLSSPHQARVGDLLTDINHVPMGKSEINPYLHPVNIANGGYRVCPSTFMEGFIEFKELEDMDTESIYLVHKAKEATAHAYAPYSRFHVGAALLLEDGSVVTGTNQENAAYPSGMCAERVALYSAASHKPGEVIVKIAVVAKKKGHKDLSPATSCGPCRQVMLEFEERQGKPMEVIMLGPGHEWIKSPSAAMLLPFAFTKTNLELTKKP